MKFSYANTERSDEPVAYIDCDGDLIVYDYEGDGIMFPSDPGEVVTGVVWDPQDRGVKHRFYKGDSVTITF